MKTFAYTVIFIAIFIAACGGGGGDDQAQVEPSSSGLEHHNMQPVR